MVGGSFSYMNTTRYLEYHLPLNPRRAYRQSRDSYNVTDAHIHARCTRVSTDPPTTLEFEGDACLQVHTGEMNMTSHSKCSI